MPKGTQFISSIEMRSLILEALSIEDVNLTPRKQTFKMYGYKGTVANLKAIVEHLALTRGLIDKDVEIPIAAWGSPGAIPWYKLNTNLSEEELDTFTEQIHFLVFQNVISPGAQGNYGDSLPYFHVTKYGLECLSARDILPYDPDNYLNKLKTFNSVDDWELFYISQSLLCYNSGAIEAAIIMLGLAGEYLTERMIKNMDKFLLKCEPALQLQYQRALTGKDKISQKYSEYEAFLRQVENLKNQNQNYKYPRLRELKPNLDAPAKNIYATYLRLTRNELAHPSCVKMDKTECLTMLVCFIKYSKTQHMYLDFYIVNS